VTGLRVMMWLFAWLLLIAARSGCADALSEEPWEGFWETYSFGDDAFMSLRQDGERVVGAYFPYDGRIVGVAEGGALRAISGLVKILLIVGSALAIADVRGLPFETVLAGLGISGLAIAIASKDLVANLFGSVIIAARPTCCCYFACSDGLGVPRWYRRLLKGPTSRLASA
jgi:small-conductance mechanosensitive channel